jgi:hypothetical protein
MLHGRLDGMLFRPEQFPAFFWVDDENRPCHFGSFQRPYSPRSDISPHAFIVDIPDQFPGILIFELQFFFSALLSPSGIFL